MKVKLLKKCRKEFPIWTEGKGKSLTYNTYDFIGRESYLSESFTTLEALIHYRRNNILKMARYLAHCSFFYGVDRSKSIEL